MLPRHLSEPTTERRVIDQDDQIAVILFENPLERERATELVRQPVAKWVPFGEVRCLPTQLAANLDQLVDVEQLVAEFIGNPVHERPRRDLATATMKLGPRVKIGPCLVPEVDPRPGR